MTGSEEATMTALVERLRAATMRFDWGDLPDDAAIPAVPLLREAASALAELTRERDKLSVDYSTAYSLLEDEVSKNVELTRERDEARVHIRRQAEDIMTLGALVYDGSNPPVEWKARATAAEEGVKRLAAAPAEGQGWQPTHRHVKRGSDYQLLGFGNMQAEGWSEYQPQYREYWRVDMREVAIYRAENGTLWVRPREEFDDGRFAPLPPIEPGEQ